MTINQKQRKEQP